MRSLFADAKTSELLSLSIQNLIDTETGRDRRDTGLTSKDVEKLYQAGQELEEQLLDPPEIADLARSAGIDEARLMRAFEQVSGTTVFDLTRQLRADRAVSKEMANE